MPKTSASHADNRPGLSALYYPYSRCTNLTALKVFALLFEEIVFTDPLEQEFREFLLFSDKGCQFVPTSVREQWRKVQDTWDFLRENGVVRVVDPVPLIIDNDPLLAASYASDMADIEFTKIAKEARVRGPWKMLVSRIPNTVNKSFAEHDALEKRVPGSDEQKYHTSDYQTGVYAWEHYDHFGYREYLIERLKGQKAQSLFGDIKGVEEDVDSSPIEEYQQLFLAGGGTCTESGIPFGMHPYSYVDTVSYKNGEPIRILSFTQGASLSLSQSLLVAEENGLIPITDSQLQSRLLIRKYQRALDSRVAIDKELLVQRPFDILQKYSILARNVLLEALSPALVEKLSIEEIYRYRIENQESLNRFWTKIREISHDLNEISSSSSFEAQIVKILDTKVVPEIQNLHNAFENSKRKAFGNLLAKLATGVPTSTAISVFAGLSPVQILAFGASTALAAFGLSFPMIIEHWQDRAQLDQHWLAFVLNLKSRTS